MKKIAVTLAIGAFCFNTMIGMSTADCYSFKSSNEPIESELGFPSVMGHYYEDQVLEDIDGNRFTLHNDMNGAETVFYQDGPSVTFTRLANGNLRYVVGEDTVIKNFAKVYYIFHSFKMPEGSYYDAEHKEFIYNGKSVRYSDIQRKIVARKYLSHDIVLQNAPDRMQFIK